MPSFPMMFFGSMVPQASSSCSLATLMTQVTSSSKDFTSPDICATSLTFSDSNTALALGLLELLQDVLKPEHRLKPKQKAPKPDCLLEPQHEVQVPDCLLLFKEEVPLHLLKDKGPPRFNQVFRTFSESVRTCCRPQQARMHHVAVDSRILIAFIVFTVVFAYRIQRAMNES